MFGFKRHPAPIVQEHACSAPEAMVAALRAYEQSHATIRTSTVNGFTHTETVPCDCALCAAARAALG